MNFRNSAYLLVSALVLLSSANSSADADVPAPCLHGAALKGTRVDLQACDVVLRRKDESGKPIGLLDGVEKYFRRAVKCYREGYIIRIDADPDEGGTKSVCGNKEKGERECECKDIGDRWDGRYHEDRACDLSQGEEEFETGIFGNQKSCGRWTEDASKNHWPYDFVSEVMDAYDAGLYVPAMRNIAKDLIDEVGRDKKFRIFSNSRCEAIATDYRDTYKKKSQELSDKLTVNVNATEYPAGSFNGGVNFCTTDDEIGKQLVARSNGATSLTDVLDKIKSLPKQAFCHLGVARGNIEAMYTYLMTCEIYSRLGRKLAKVADEQTANLDKMIADPSTKQGCADLAAKHGDSVGHDASGISCGRGCATRKGHIAGNIYFRDCIKPKFKKYIRDIIEQYFPAPYLDLSGPTGADNFQFPLLFAFGTLGIGAQRRRERWARARKVLKHATVFLSINVFVLVLAVKYAIGGCCSDDPAVHNQINTCQGQFQDDKVDKALMRKCCLTDNISSSAITQCNPDVMLPENAPTLCKDCGGSPACAPCRGSGGAESKAAGAGGGAGDAQGAAEKFNSNTGNIATTEAGKAEDVESNPNLGQTNSAASDTGLVTKNKDAKKTELAAGEGKKDEAKTGGRAGGKAGGATAGGGLNFGGDSGTGPATKDGSTGSAAQGGESLGGYSGGGGAGGKSGGGGGDGSGSNAGVSAAGAAAQVGFGAGADGEAGARDGAGKVEDPDDYFTRTNLDENIFKKVEKKYTERSRTWTINDSHAKPETKGPTKRP